MTMAFPQRPLCPVCIAILAGRPDFFEMDGDAHPDVTLEILEGNN
jgi:hypothetical protein